MRAFLAAALAVAATASCSKKPATRPPAAIADGGGVSPDAGPPRPARPPTPPLDTRMPEQLLPALPRKDGGTDGGGLPILLHATGATGGLALAYDDTLDDPTRRWGHCLGRVQSCYQANFDRPMAGCVDLIERCATNLGGRGCCPPACIQAFKDRLAAGATEDRAVDESFVRGTCVEGFVERRWDAGVTP